MAELKNTFCWSFSQSKDFNDCRRRHYWNRYGFWGGWDAGAPDIARTAYRLKQMGNKWSLIGDAVDRTIAEVVHRLSVGADISYEQALQKANTLLREAWKQHCTGKWRRNPKHCVCIREVYYDEISSEPSIGRDAWADSVKDRTETCLKNFFSRLLPRLKGIIPKDIIPVTHVDQGDPEHFFLGQVKIYAIPDCAYTREGRTVILDWKTGARRDEHQRQIRIYGLWAQMKHEIPIENIDLSLEYLESGESVPVPYTIELASETCDRIMASVNEMREYIVDGDIQRNEPKPEETFAKTDELDACRICNYLELCNRQFVLKMDE
jgi:hypothetical protein